MSGTAKRVLAALVACCLAVGAQAAVIETIPFYSGGTGDGATYVAAKGPGVGVVTEADFLAIYSDFIVNYATPAYSLASVLNGVVDSPDHGINPFWKTTEIPGTGAQWVSTRPDGGTEDYHKPGGVTNYTVDIESGLYAIKINNNTGYNTAVLHLIFAADNWLGWPTEAEMAANPNYNAADRAVTGYENGVPMLFVNDVAYDANGMMRDRIFDALRDFGGGISDGLAYITFNITLKDGENWIFINAANGGTGGPHGVIFAGEVQIIPEPVTMSLLGLGGLAMLRRRKR